MPRAGDFSALARFAGRPWNNIGHRTGNPPGSNHTKAAERAVLAWAADLFFGLRTEGEWWGSLTTGGTGGNRAGLLAARDAFPTDERGLTSAVCYYAESDHYSIPKLLHELCIPAVPVRARPEGEMDYDDLYESLRPDSPAIVNLGVPAWRHTHAFTVVFPEPPAQILHDWPVYRDHDGRCHLACMPGVTRQHIDAYVAAVAAALPAELRRAPRQRSVPHQLAIEPAGAEPDRQAC